MSDDATPPANSAAGGGGSGVFVPLLTQQQHPELVGLILKSESMDESERQYWIDILPMMNPDQLQQLRSILTQERDQLAAIDAKYAGTAEPEAPARSVEEIESARRDRSSRRSAQEMQSEGAETQAEEEILKQVQDL